MMDNKLLVSTPEKNPKPNIYTSLDQPIRRQTIKYCGIFLVALYFPGYNHSSKINYHFFRTTSKVGSVIML